MSKHSRRSKFHQNPWGVPLHNRSSRVKSRLSRRERLRGYGKCVAAMLWTMLQLGTAQLVLDRITILTSSPTPPPTTSQSATELPTAEPTGNFINIRTTTQPSAPPTILMPTMVAQNEGQGSDTRRDRNKRMAINATIVVACVGAAVWAHIRWRSWRKKNRSSTQSERAGSRESRHLPLRHQDSGPMDRPLSRMTATTDI